MSPRPRKPKNQGLPPNLSQHPTRGYYRYRRPIDGKEFHMGSDRAAAIDAANQLNAVYSKGSGLVAKVVGESTRSTVAKFLEQYWDAIAKDRKWSPITCKDYGQKRVHLETAFGSSTFDAVTVLQVAEFLDQYPPTQSNRYRALLSTVWTWAIAKGWAAVNLPDQTIPKNEEVKRQRLTLEDFNRIREKASQPIKDAMDLALHTLQRRGDIARMTRDHYKNGILEVIQGKTGAPIRIHVDAPLETVLKRCRGDGSFSTYLVHQPLTANKKRRRNGLSPESVSRGFQKARDAAGLYSDLDPAERPTFHEIRALGARLYREAGVSKEVVQMLLGHTQEKTTDVYLSRHEIKWAEVRGGLDLEGK